MSDENENVPWWMHAVNAVVAGVEVSTKRKNAEAQQEEAEREARRRQRAKGSRGNSGFAGLAGPKRRVKLDPDEPCCEGPRRK